MKQSSIDWYLLRFAFIMLVGSVFIWLQDPQQDQSLKPQQLRNQNYKLKAILYNFLPYTTEDKKKQQFKNLEEKIQKIIDKNGIQVQVELSADIDIYNVQSLLQLYKSSDIIQIDALFLTQLQKNIQIMQLPELFTFSRSEIGSRTFDQLYKFQWKSLQTKNKVNQSMYLGFPTIMCSDFVQSVRKIDHGKEQDSNTSLDFIQKQYKLLSLSTLYASFFLNIKKNSTLDSIDYENIDNQVFNEYKKFFLKCQKKQQLTFDMSDNYCLNGTLNKQFGSKNSSAALTIGFSQYLFLFPKLFNFQTNLDFSFEGHPMNKMAKRLIYLDHFIAKKPKNIRDKEKILSFYRLMVSNQVLDIYTKGSYLDRTGQYWPNFTYLLPPREQYFKNLSQQSDNKYKKLYQIFNLTGNSDKPEYQVLSGHKFYQFYPQLSRLILDKLNISALF